MAFRNPFRLSALRPGALGLIRSRWRPADALEAVSVAILLFVVPHFLGGAGVPQPSPGMVQLLSGILVFPFATLLLVLCGVARRARDRREILDTVFGLVPRRAFLRAVGFGAACGVAAVPFAGALAAATELALVRLGVEVAPQNAMALFLDSGAPALHRVILAAHAVALAPLCEEILFRGILLAAFLRGARGSDGVAGDPPVVRAILLSALFFAGVHMYLPGLPALAVLGALFAALRLRERTLWASVAAHAAFNACNLVIAGG